MSRSAKVKGPTTIKGSLSVPGDKSISHRAALLASLANGTSTIKGYSSGADCAATLDCLRRLGITTEIGNGTLNINGKGMTGYGASINPAILDAANSGSTMRMISGVLAAQPFVSIIDGDASLRRRPMNRIIEPLRLMGAEIVARDTSFPPLTITGTRLRSIEYSSPVASAQVKSCVLLAGLFAQGRTRVREPYQSRNHTELMLPAFGVKVQQDDDWISVEGPAELLPASYTVPGDMSSAAFFAAAAAMLPGSALEIRDVNLNPTRTALLEVLEQLGAKIERTNLSTIGGETNGTISVSSDGLRAETGGTMIRGRIIPKLIDELPMLAVVATQTEGRIEIRDARELRIKESDRIRKIIDCIRALGGRIEEFDDGFAIEGPQKLRGARLDSAGDHRIAMAFSVAGLAASGSTEIVDSECVAVSFPEFYDVLKTLVVSDAA